MEIEREGETLFVLTEDGINLWTAFIQGGRRADGSRVTTSDAAKIAANIQSMPKRIAELEAQLKTANEIIRNAVDGLMDAPEINPGNYTHDQVFELNRQVCYVFSFLIEYADAIEGK